MTGPLESTLIVLAAILGAAVGGVIGFFGTYYAVVLFWREAFAIGWIFCFFTVPLGAAIGGLVCARVTGRIVRRYL